MDKKIFSMAILLILGCSNRQKEYHDVQKITPSSSIEISHISYNKEFIMGIPSQLELIDNQLLLFYLNGCYARIMDTKDGTFTGDFGRKGQGPNEFISFLYAGKDTTDRKLYTWDVSSQKMNQYVYHNEKDTLRVIMENQTKRERDDLIYYIIHYLSNGYFVAHLAFCPSGSDAFALINKDLKTVKLFGSSPFPLEMADRRYLRGTISSFGNQFVFAGFKYGYIVSYEVSDTGEISKKWEYFASTPLYQYDHAKLKWDINSLYGFYDVKMTSKYVFALYSGIEDDPSKERIPKNLWVFDLDGNFIQSFKLDQACGRISVSEKNEVYASSTVHDSEIIKYDLSAYLE
jgi:hypothetical protein